MAAILPCSFCEVALIMTLRLTLLALLLGGTVAASAQYPNPIQTQTLLQTATTCEGLPLRYPQGPAQITALTVDIAPGAQTGWHHHPMPSVAYLLQGQLQVRLRDGRTQTVKAGEALAEVVDTEHNGTNIGTEPARLVVFYLGVSGQSLTHAGPAPK